MTRPKPTKLTDKYVQRLPLAGKDDRGRVQSYAVRDTEVKGLMVIIHSERKVYALQRDGWFGERDASGAKRIRTRRKNLGDVRHMLPEDARRAAREIINLIQQGVDPSTPEPKAAPVLPITKAVTLRTAWSEYKSELLGQRRSLRTIIGYENALRRHLSDWLDRPLEEIGHDRRGVRARHRALSEKRENGVGGPYVANGVMRVLRAVYRSARRVDLNLPPPPTEAIRFNKESKRKDVVADLGAWFMKLEMLPNPIRRDLHLFLLLTGMRRSAACEAQWKHFDPEAGFLHVPRPKGGEDRAFDLPLSTFLVTILKARRAENEHLYPGSPWIFPADSSTGHVAEPKEDGLPSPHVLRHTYASAAAGAGLSKLDIKLLLNHALTDVTDGYIHSTALGYHLRACQEKLTAHLLARMQRGRERQRGSAYSDPVIQTQ